MLYINPRRCHSRPSISYCSLSRTQSRRRRAVHLRAVQFICRKTTIGADIASHRRVLQPICLMRTSLDRFNFFFSGSIWFDLSNGKWWSTAEACQRADVCVCVSVRSRAPLVRLQRADSGFFSWCHPHKMTDLEDLNREGMKKGHICLCQTTGGNPGWSINCFCDSSQGLCHLYGVLSTCRPLKVRVKWTLMPSQQEEGGSASLIRRVHCVLTELLCGGRTGFVIISGLVGT